MNELLESWHIHNRTNLFLLDAIPEEQLACLSSSKGRSVGEGFAHMHTVRVMWLKPNDKALHEVQPEITGSDASNKDLIREALTQSAAAIEEMIKRREKAGKSVSGFKPHTTAFISYLISHESHHRGQILLILKQAGHPVDKNTSYGMWEWGAR